MNNRIVSLICGGKTALIVLRYNFRTFCVFGTVLEIGKKDYQGFLTRPASWKRIMEKFNNPDAPLADKRLRDEMNTMVEGLERYQ